jgi:hypothetical protein
MHGTRMSIFDRIARLLTLGSSSGPTDLSWRTLEAAYRRQSEALQEARLTVVELIAAEKMLGSGRIGDLRAQRLALESNSEKLRLRMDLFRSEKLSVGANYVASGAASRSGDTLAVLTAEIAEVTRMVERAKQTLADLESENFTRDG